MTVDESVNLSHKVLGTEQEQEERSVEREKRRQERADEMRIQFEDRVALAKNDMNMDLDQKITQLRTRLADIEKAAVTSSLT